MRSTCARPCTPYTCSSLFCTDTWKLWPPRLSSDVLADHCTSPEGQPPVLGVGALGFFPPCCLDLVCSSHWMRFLFYFCCLFRFCLVFRFQPWSPPPPPPLPGSPP